MPIKSIMRFLSVIMHLSIRFNFKFQKADAGIFPLHLPLVYFILKNGSVPISSTV